MAIKAARSDLAEALARFGEAKLVKDAAESDFSDAQDELLKLMGEQVTATGKFVYEGDIYEIKATKVAASRITTDEVALKKKVGAALWGKITKRVLDKSKLEDAIAQGMVDPTIVASCCEELPNKVFIRPTIKRMFKPRRK